jgi:NAD(P)-dependent dehydrogenase (short-subunit alcohol dehydrogenase family)
LEGKVAVITGGYSGIGLATAQRFVSEGAFVFIAGRRETELDKAKSLIGKNVTAVPGDVTKNDYLDHLTARVRSEKRVVNIIVASAGITEQGYIDTITPEHFDKVFNLNGRAPVFLVNKLLPLMSRGGSIILISSAMHVMGIPGHTAYAATKAALRSYARTWAAEFKDRGIRVNTLSPGVTDTPMLDSQGSGLGGRDSLVKMYVGMVPLGRLGTSEEVASAALFLASEDRAYMTGADLMNDGGVGQV